MPPANSRRRTWFASSARGPSARRRPPAHPTFLSPRNFLPNNLSRSNFLPFLTFPDEKLTVYAGSLHEVAGFSFKDELGRPEYPVFEEDRGRAEVEREWIARRSSPYPSAANAAPNPHRTGFDAPDTASVVLRDLDGGVESTGCRDVEKIKTKAVVTLTTKLRSKFGWGHNGTSGPSMADRRRCREAIELIESGTVKPPHFEGYVVAADLAVDPEDVLEGERSLADQSKVLAFMQKEYPEEVRPNLTGSQAYLIAYMFVPLSECQEPGVARSPFMVEAKVGEFLLAHGIRAYRQGQYAIQDRSQPWPPKEEFVVLDNRPGFFEPLAVGKTAKEALTNALPRLTYSVTVFDPAVIVAVRNEKTLPQASEQEVVEAYLPAADVAQDQTLSPSL